MTSVRGRSGILFDVDGTLMDTVYIHTVCWWEALRQYDQIVPMAEIHGAIGMGSDKLLGHVLGDHDRSRDADIAAAHGALFATWYTRICPLPGARDLLARCAELGLTVVLATSGTDRDVRALRKALDADAFLDEVTSSADAQESKPSPDILSAALDRTGLSASQVVFVGDAVWDVQASATLGIRCIGLESGGTSNVELREAGAVEVWKNPADLLRNVDSSILLRDDGASMEKMARIANAAASSSRSDVGRKGGKAGDYQDWSKDELLDRAREIGIGGRSRMSKAELIEALRNH